MTDPPDFDGEVPQRFLDLIDEALADQAQHPPPISLEEHRRERGIPKRVLAYGAVAAAAVVLAVVGLAALEQSDLPTVDTERAATPSSSATSTPASGVVGDAVRAQIAADAEVAAGFGLTLGPRVFSDDGSFVVADQPDLTPVYDRRDELVGYALHRDIDPNDEEQSVIVYGPDGVTVRGVFNLPVGFTPAAGQSNESGD